jgi:hypothetical protein
LQGDLEAARGERENFYCKDNPENTDVWCNLIFPLGPSSIDAAASEALPYIDTTGDPEEEVGL